MNVWPKRWASSATGHQTPNQWERGEEKGQGCREGGASDGLCSAISHHQVQGMPAGKGG